MTYRHTLALALFTVLTACKGSCSCGSDGDDGGAGGTDPTTSTSTSSSPTTSTTTGGSGGAGGDATATGAGGSGGDTTVGTGGQGGGTPVSLRECEVAEDCQLVNDCCTCDAIPGSETPEECLAQCLQPVCSEKQLPNDAAVSCIAGRCVAGFECNWAVVTCDAAPPDCEAGFTASVVEGCYGACVLTTECTSVGSCDQCDDELACVEQVGFGTSTHCVTDGGACDPDDCECLGESVCNEGDVCKDEGGVVSCTCTTC